MIHVQIGTHEGKTAEIQTKIILRIQNNDPKSLCSSSSTVDIDLWLKFTKLGIQPFSFNESSIM